MVQTIAEELGLRTGEGTSGGLSQFSRSENGTVPLRSATVVFSPVLTQLQAKQIVQKTIDSIVDILVADGRVELRNFGVFEVKRRKPRKARNPRTGGKVMVPEKCAVTFKPGRLVEERIDRECRTAASGVGADQPASKGPGSALT
jgi:nucleoid DNA-binding protein